MCCDSADFIHGTVRKVVSKYRQHNSGEFKIGERYQVAMPEQSNDAEVTNNIQLPVPPIEDIKNKPRTCSRFTQ